MQFKLFGSSISRLLISAGLALSLSLSIRAEPITRIALTSVEPIETKFRVTGIALKASDIASLLAKSTTSDSNPSIVMEISSVSGCQIRAFLFTALLNVVPTGTPIYSKEQACALIESNSAR